MTRSLSFVVALSLAAAAPAQPVVVPVPTAEMQPGYGVVESVTEVQVRERSAAAGGSSRERSPALPAYRVAVRMEDGSVQYRDLDQPEFRPGDHVLLTNAGDVLPD